MGALFNLARMTTPTTGTGAITLGSAVSGFLTFTQSGVADGTTVSYGIADGANSEVGQGVYTASGTTLTRIVTKSTNSDTAIPLSGNAQVYVTARAEDIAGYLPLTGGTLTGSLNMTVGSFYQYGGIPLAYIVPNAGGNNTFFAEAGNPTTTGSVNLGTGLGALAALTSGNNNIAIGRNSLAVLTTGNSNAAIGYLALTGEQTGTYNYALGVQALNTQNGASRNVGVGAISGYDLTTGSNNVCIGYSTGRGITTGSGNTVIGYNLTGLPAALAGTMVLGANATRMSLVWGSNCFHGGSAGNLTLTGTANACMGWLSGTALTTGSNNCALGSSALTAETTGGSNVALGKSALSTQNGASSNIAIGNNAGNTITTGSTNIFIGANAGNTITTGTGNVMINYSGGLLAAGTTNCFGWGLAGNIRYDYGLTTASTHTFTGGPVAANATPTAGATPVFQSAGALSQASATTNTPALPATRTNGWLMLAFCRVTGATGTTVTCPTAGWTQIGVNSGGGHYFMMAYAYVTGSEVAPVFTLGISDTSDAQVVMYSGTAATNPIGAFNMSSGGAVTSISLTGILTTRYNTKVVATILAGGLTGAITPPGAYTQQVSNTDGAWFDAAQTTAGVNTGSLIFTVGSAVTNWGGFVVELLIPPITPAANRFIGNVLGTTRWAESFGDGTQEAGSNAGSNYALSRYSDSGSLIDSPLTISRSSGLITTSKSINVPTGSTYQHNAKNLAFSVPSASGDNVFFGQAGNTTATGAANSSLGALSSSALTSANNNTVVGYNALNAETSGSQNTAVGRGALNVQNGGGSNTALGYLAGSGITTGSSNLLVGYNAAPGLSTGSNNTIIGTTPSLAAATANTIILGQNSIIRYDWNYTTTNTHTFAGGAVRLSTGLTVATLPAAGPTGATCYVTDGAASLAWGATVTGGGSTPYLVWYNGTAWTVVGK